MSNVEIREVVRLTVIDSMRAVAEGRSTSEVEETATRALELMVGDPCERCRNA